MGAQKVQAADTADPETSQTHTAAHFMGANNKAVKTGKPMPKAYAN